MDELKLPVPPEALRVSRQTSSVPAVSHLTFDNRQQTVELLQLDLN